MVSVWNWFPWRFRYQSPPFFPDVSFSGCLSFSFIPLLFAFFDHLTFYSDFCSPRSFLLTINTINIIYKIFFTFSSSSSDNRYKTSSFLFLIWELLFSKIKWCYTILSFLIVFIILHLKLYKRKSLNLPLKILLRLNI